MRIILNLFNNVGNLLEVEILNESCNGFVVIAFTLLNFVALVVNVLLGIRNVFELSLNNG